MWFPGGIVIGSLLSKLLTDMSISWQSQMWIIMIPTIIYAFLFYGKAFPMPKKDEMTSLNTNLKAMFSVPFIFLFLCMALTSISEFGPQQWIGIIMSHSGASPMLILALVTGVMAVGRFFAGSVINFFGQAGVLLFSAIFSSVGIYMFSMVTGELAYVAAFIFAIGVCYFWPTMIGATAKLVPLSGALGLSIIGGVGMFSTSIFQPIIGRWIDKSKEMVTDINDSLIDVNLLVGQTTLAKLAIFPAILIIVFAVFFFIQKRNSQVVTTNPLSAE